MATIYSYRIIVKLEAYSPEFNLDLYQIDGETLQDALEKKLQDYMSANPNRATTVNSTDTQIISDSRLEVIAYYFREGLNPIGDELGGFGNIDDLMKDSIKSARTTKQGLPQPPIFTWRAELDSNPYGGEGKKITFTLQKQIQTTETYVADTTAYKRRGLVKIQGQAEYSSAGQVLGKNFLTNTNVVSSDNLTHTRGADTPEQIENSIAVSIWYFKNKTTGNLDTIEYKSKIPKNIYTDEYNRIKSILG
jgi:hypothetical protein